MFTFRYLVITCLSALLMLSGCADLDLSEITPRAPETLTVRVTGPVVNLRAGPGLDFTVLSTVQEGERLAVTGRTASGGWLQVQVADAPHWIYAGLTNISGDELAQLPVELPPLGASLSSNAGQSASAVPEVTPEPDLGSWNPPGSYSRDLPGLDYEWELIFIDASDKWDWQIEDEAGCYDAMRVYLGDWARAEGLKRVKFELKNPPVEQDITSRPMPQGTHYRGAVMGGLVSDVEPLEREWPNWEGKVPPDIALVQSQCWDWPWKREQYDLGEYTCEVFPMWGTTTTEQGIYNLNAAAIAVAVTNLGSVLHHDQFPAAERWIAQSWARANFLYPASSSNQPVGNGVCMQLIRRN